MRDNKLERSILIAMAVGTAAFGIGCCCIWVVEPIRELAAAVTGGLLTFFAGGVILRAGFKRSNDASAHESVELLILFGTLIVGGGLLIYGIWDYLPF